MGITGVLVRSVFSKSHGNQASNSGSEKKKWSSSVRSYLCCDELSSVLAASARNSTVAAAAEEEEEEEDFSSFRSNVATITSSTCIRDMDTASVRSSEATVNQPLSVASELENVQKKQNSTCKLFQQEDAALIIQSAFRNFLVNMIILSVLARQGRGEAKWYDEAKLAATPSRESVGTSIEVQTGNSTKEERVDVQGAVRRRTGAQVLKIQEDWDGSTVSSVISKLRMQNKLEAATRRERALAYAFSQQLRICSKKKQITGNGEEANMGWSWLERWMAARQPEISFIQDNSTKTLVRKRILDAAMEEESCGSNEVSSLVEACNIPCGRGKGQEKETKAAWE